MAMEKKTFLFSAKNGVMVADLTDTLKDTPDVMNTLDMTKFKTKEVEFDNTTHYWEGDYDTGSVKPMHDKTIMMNNIWLKLKTSADLVDGRVVEQALDNNQAALEHLGKTHPQTAFSYFVLGGVYAADGQFEAANNAYLSLLNNNIVTADNPRYLALCQAISQNYQSAGQIDKAFEYANKGWQAAEKMMGSQATRTLQLRLAMLDLMNKDDKRYAEHIQDLQRMVKDDGMTDSIMLQALTQWLQENLK